MEYIKVTDELPDPNTEVMTFNGETEFKNEHNGVKWKYQLKYPITHWRYKAERPPQKEVKQVRKELMQNINI